MSEEQFEQIEVALEDAQKAVLKMDALKRLIKNDDFQLVIDKGYFEQEASNLVISLSNPSYTKEQVKKTEQLIRGISCLSSYFGAINYSGNQATKAIRDLEETKQELLLEGEE